MATVSPQPWREIDVHVALYLDGLSARRQSHPSTIRARRGATSLIRHNALALRHATIDVINVKKAKNVEKIQKKLL